MGAVGANIKVLFFVFWHVWDSVKTSGKQKENRSLWGKKKKAALECTVIAHKKKKKTLTHVWRERRAEKKKHVQTLHKNKNTFFFNVQLLNLAAAAIQQSKWG